MSDEVGNAEDRDSRDAAHLVIVSEQTVLILKTVFLSLSL